MSVTFSIEAIETGAFTADCHDTGSVLTADSYEGIRLEIAAHRLLCTDCDAYGMYPRAVLDVDAEVNLANGNAAMVLRALDLDSEDLCGQAPGEAFLGHVLIALGQDRDDSAVPTVEYPRPIDDDGRPVGARLIACGLPAGYMTDTLLRLHSLAQEAARLGRDIT